MLNLVDLAVFQIAYSTIPKQVQNGAILVSVECCLVGPVAASLGACWSGPGQSTIPQACAAASRCTFEFSESLELGDELYEICRNAVEPTDDVLPSICENWSNGANPVVFDCHTTPPVAMGFFVVADEDGDTDVDLADFARLQTDWPILFDEQ